MSRYPFLAFLLLLATSACSSGTTEVEGNGVCTPGEVVQCICYATGGPGYKKCQFTKTWSGCDCSGDITVFPGDVAEQAGNDATGGKPPVGPGESPPGGASEGSGGGVGLESENFGLRLYVAPARPVGTVESEHYRLRLGPPQPE